MSVTVTPEAFRFVQFDSGTVTRVAQELIAALGIDRPVHIEIDETTPLGRVRATIGAADGDAIAISVESGAFELAAPAPAERSGHGCQPRAHPAASARSVARRVR